MVDQGCCTSALGIAYSLTRHSALTGTTCPFALIVGINNHTQSILLGYALLLDETTETFVWVLQTLKAAMGGMALTNIMTD